MSPGFQSEYRHSLFQSAQLGRHCDFFRPENQSLYDKGIAIPSLELPRSTFLRSISGAERAALKDLFCSVLGSRFLIYNEIVVLAVGTTTFPESYWNGLQKYLAAHDPFKLPFVERRGEDIDLLLCAGTRLQIQRVTIPSRRLSTDGKSPDEIDADLLWYTEIQTALKSSNIEYEMPD